MVRKIAKKVINLWLPVILWSVMIFLFSSKSTPSVSQIYWPDFVVKKTAHVLIYGVLATMIYRALKESGVDKIEAGVYAVILAGLYGFSDEFHQSFTPGRTPALRDVFFDIIGASIFIYLIWNLLPKAPETLKRWAKNLQLL